jgi:hypothetical protein
MVSLEEPLVVTRGCQASKQGNRKAVGGREVGRRKVETRIVAKVMVARPTCREQEPRSDRRVA